MPLFTPDDFRARFEGRKRLPTYRESVDLHNRLRVHADGEMPISIIKKARPHESDNVKDYRVSIYEPETQNPVERVLGVLEKIRRSPDWMIRFDNEAPAIINEEETLEKYLTEKYPVYGHIEDWLFQEALKNLALDANSIIAVIPKNWNVGGTEYIEPVAYIYNAKTVIDYQPEDYVLIKSEEFSSLLPAEIQEQKRVTADAIKTDDFIMGQVYYYIDKVSYIKYELNSQDKYEITARYPHRIGQLPAFQMPGKFVRRVGNNIVKKTLLYAMVPHLNKAARESNDLDAGVIKHLHLKEWEINNNPCSNCEGTGKVSDPVQGIVKCGKCEGSGYATSRGPLGKIVVRPAAIGDQNIPTPPMGYVDLNPEILKIANDRVHEHIYKALAAVNMEHLAETQLNQSGVAKQYDGDEVNNLIYAFAGDLVTVLTTVNYFITELRYQIVNREERAKMRPIVPIPEKFDVVNTSFLLGEYQIGKNAGLSDIILAEMQKEISQKKFYSNPKVADFVRTVMDVDPFPALTIEEKSMMEGQGLATKEDVILSNYISDFVRQAMEDNDNFNKKSIKEKRDILMKFVKEKMVELDKSTQLATDIIQQQSNPEGSAPPVDNKPMPALQSN